MKQFPELLRHNVHGHPFKGNVYDGEGNEWGFASASRGGFLTLWARSAVVADISEHARPKRCRIRLVVFRRPKWPANGMSWASFRTASLHCTGRTNCSVESMLPGGWWVLYSRPSRLKNPHPATVLGLPSATSRAWVGVPSSICCFRRSSVEISNACILGGGGGLGWGLG